jgi:uncharacterized protein
MTTLLARLADLTGRRPGRSLLVLALLTVALGVAASDQESDTELTAFAPDSEIAMANERVQDEFGAGGQVLQVVVDAGSGGDVLSAEGIEAATRIEAAVAEADVEVADGEAGLRTYARPVVARLADQGIDPAGASSAEIDAAAATDTEDGPNQLLSGDADLEAGTARAGLVVIAFPPTMDDGDIYTSSLELAERIDAVDAVDGIDISPFSPAVLNDALERESEEEMPRLLSLSMLLILGILLFQYRTVSDVLVGLVGLIATIVWMFGFGVLLGPEYLGIVGPFTQISLIIPVLLIGLGIDYAIHLTSRYREEQRHGQAPDRAASMAVRTVGGALVLATATTVLGFLTNLVSPLPPIADFGVFTAVGVLSAFVIMTVLVPASRNLLDARRLRRSGDAARTTRAAERSGGLASLIGRTAVVAERTPRLALAVALVVSVAATGAASQVSTTFSQEDFIPADSDIGRLLDRIDENFGGGINETTFVVVDGDLTDPAVARAMADVTAAVADTDGVRSTGGVAQVDSPVGLVATLAAADPAFADDAEALGYTPDDGFAADADVAGLYDLARAAEPGGAAGLLADDDRSGVIAIGTVAGQDGARALAEELRADLEPLVAAGVDATITSEPLVLEESLDALTDSQTQGIVITLAAALVLLIAYYGVTERKPVLGVITMIPSLAVVSWVLGTMWLLGITFNVLTAMVASLGIGIGVPFGIHVTHRFLEDRRRYDTIDEAVRQTVTHTGGAMAGSAATTATGFGVLVFASLVPMQQFGTIVAITILYSFVAAVLIQPSCLKLWGERRARRGEQAALHAHEHRDESTTATVEREPVGADC